MLAVRRLSATYTRGKLTVEAGKQFIRWGKTDVLNPTDRFAPRDFVNVVDNEFLAITAGAAHLRDAGEYDRSRILAAADAEPRALLNQRWAVLPPGFRSSRRRRDFPAVRSSARGGIISGRRRSTRSRSTTGTITCRCSAAELRVPPFRSTATIRRCGCTGAMRRFRFRTVTLKAEAGYFTSKTPQADEYVLYVRATGAAERANGRSSAGTRAR